MERHLSHKQHGTWFAMVDGKKYLKLILMLPEPKRTPGYPL